jgi:hypothetical protein
MQANFIKNTIYIALLLLCSNSVIGQSSNHSRTKQLPDGRYVLDCSGYQYLLKQSPIFVGGKAQMEQMLTEAFRDIAIEQPKNRGIGCDITLRLYPSGRTKFIKFYSLKTKHKANIKKGLQRIFIDNHRWTAPIFIDKKQRPVDIFIYMSVIPNTIEYSVTIKNIDECESGICYGSITIR